METYAEHRHLSHGHLVATTELWMLALTTILLACSAVLLVVWNPEALGIALAIGLVAIGTRMAFGRVRESVHQRAEASSAVASTGLVIAAIAVAPLLAFALLWTGLLLLLGVMWFLGVLGIL